MYNVFRITCLIQSELFTGQGGHNGDDAAREGILGHVEQAARKMMKKGGQITDRRNGL